MKKITRYELENDYNYYCDHQERNQHINKIELMKTREQQEEYIELYDDVIERKVS